MHVDSNEMNHSVPAAEFREINASRTRRGAHRRRPEAIPFPFPDDHPTDSDEPTPLWVMKITQPALFAMMQYLLGQKPEAAGILLGPDDDDILITHFVPDRTGDGTAVSFSLGQIELNRTLKRVRPAKIDCRGIGHSHPRGIPSPSQGDLAYLRRLFAANGSPTSPFFMPIVCGSRLYPHVYVRGAIQPALLEVV